MDTQNVIIIGGGAAGLSAALYLARAGLAPLIFAGSPPGGQLMLTSEVENFPGQKSILGGELIDTMRKQALSFGAKIIDENCISVEISNQLKSVSTVDGNIYQTKALIISTGAKALWLGIPSETRLRGKGVSACATCDGFFFKNKTVAVLGGGDSALEEALTLTKFASKVYLIHRRDVFKASKIMQKRVQENPKIEIIFNAVVTEIIGEAKVESVKISQSQLNQLKQKTDSIIQVDGVFVAIGHRPDTDLFKGKIELDEKGYVITSQMYGLELLKSVKTSLNQLKSAEISNQLESVDIKTDFNRLQQISTNFNYRYQTMTSAEGVFGAGDCVDHVYKQASTAAGMGVQASLDAERYLENSI